MPGANAQTTHTVALGSKYHGAGDQCVEYAAVKEDNKVVKGKYTIKLSASSETGNRNQDQIAVSNSTAVNTDARNSLLINQKCRLLPNRNKKTKKSRKMPERYKFTRAVACSCNHWKFKLFATWKLEKTKFQKMLAKAKVAEKTGDRELKLKDFKPLLSLLSIKEIDDAVLKKENSTLALPTLATVVSHSHNGTKDHCMEMATAKLTVADISMAIDNRKTHKKIKCKHMMQVDEFIIENIKKSKAAVAP